MTTRLYQSVVSIGSQCATSVMLQNADLKRFSGPFDWIFSNLRMVCDCIEDDFATFLDPSQIIAIPPETRTMADAQFAHHDHYRRRYNIHAIFNHSDPTLPEVYAYLQRCVARFRALLAADRPQLLVALSRRDQGGSYAFNRLCDLLKTKPNIEICVLIVRETGEHRSIDLWEERGPNRLFNLHCTSPLAGIHFEAAEDNHFVVETLRSLAQIEE